MLVATRDPLPHPGAHDAPRPDAGHPVPRAARFMTALQVVGSLLAIPVGLASAYSIYRTNFSVESTCQSLRGNIIAMIDKQVDAGTRRMLVRRDVETFEKTCGTVDPDAEAAFKTLLAADKPAAEARPAASAKDSVRKSEAHPTTAAKPSVAPVAAVAAVAAPVEHDAAADTKWLAAVRGALVSHPPGAAPAPESHAVSKAPVAAPMTAAVPAATAPKTEDALAAPALPSATSVAALPAQPVAADHPVPPGTIPETGAAASDSWVGKIPFVGQALAR